MTSFFPRSRTFDYSYLMVTAGSVRAARIAWEMTVNWARRTVAAPAGIRIARRYIIKFRA